MRSAATFVLAGVLSSVPVLAQPPAFTLSANPVSDSVRDVLARESKNLIASAALMTMVQTVKGTDSKDALAADIKQSFDFCTGALATTDDSKLGEEVSMMGRGMGRSRASAMVTIATDWADHYSTAASYLRLNGILPPSAPRAK